tara:strand:- start:4675 stop:5175 length:501 start_codon:yes stop_codon:yes gene_type:complete
MRTSFRYFKTSPEIICLAVMMASFSSCDCAVWARWRAGGDRRSAAKIGDTNLPAHWRIASPVDRPVGPGKCPLQGLGADQRLAGVPERIGIGRRIAPAKPAKPHPAQTVTDQKLRLFQEQPVHGLQDKHLELQHWIEARTPALGRIDPLECLAQNRSENLEVDRRR